ncbi:exo-alpha-sialidase [Mycoplasmopsis alligatoris]|uniref:exo-alpha-sialidase n=1 Tax=Mycoplasmopsis alligatoris A21JP2 TaxID=747682 RepID=D4XW92_9BACT|nr:sialidase family protein [Mycoplasmopsis alligatoris]EFF41391.1 BNR/Asp-box repeat protein [Mycoplasmopsis alligatoris A21JP2]
MNKKCKNLFKKLKNIPICLSLSTLLISTTSISYKQNKQIHNNQIPNFIINKNVLENNNKKLNSELNFTIIEKSKPNFIYDHQYQNSHSYRIPSLVKSPKGKLVTIVDKRLDNWSDSPKSRITQVIRTSDDQGKTWSEAQEIFSIENKSGLFAGAIDSAISYAGNDLLMAVDVFQGTGGLFLGNLNEQNSDFRIGYTKHGFMKFYRLTANKTYENLVLVPLETNQGNNLFLRAYKPKDSKLNFDQMTKENIEPIDIIVDNSFDPISKKLRGRIYENVKKLSDIQKDNWKYSIWDGKNNDIVEWKTPKYKIDNTSYMYLFRSKDGGKTWNIEGSMNPQTFKGKNTDYNFALLGPGVGIQLKNQKLKYMNGRIIFPFYTYKIGKNSGDKNVYMAYSDDNGKSWKSSDTYTNETNGFYYAASETQLYEDKDGVLYALLRNVGNKLFVSKSKDGGNTWSSLIEDDHPLTIITPSNNKNYKSNLVTSVAHGLDYVNFNGIGLSFFSLPKGPNRTNGALFVAQDNDFKNFKKIYDFPTIDKSDNNFAYSSLKVISINKDIITLGVLYESNITKKDNIGRMSYQLIKIKVNKVEDK